MAGQNGLAELELSQIIDQEILRTKGKGGRTRRAPDVGLWAVRGVDLETRAIIEKGASRAGKTMGQYINEDVRSLVQSQLTLTQLPAATVDIQNQIDHLTKLVEALTNRMPESVKKSFWQRLFNLKYPFLPTPALLNLYHGYKRNDSVTSSPHERFT